MQEIEARAILSQQQLQIVKGQIGAKQRDIRLLQLTSRELDTLPESTKVYEGVGKMYVVLPFTPIQKQMSITDANGSIREGIGSFWRSFLWFKDALKTKKKASKVISKIWRRNSDTLRPRLRRRRTTSTKFSTREGDESETVMARGSDGDEEGRGIAGEERKRADERNGRNERNERNEC